MRPDPARKADRSRPVKDKVHRPDTPLAPLPAETPEPPRSLLIWWLLGGTALFFMIGAIGIGAVVLFARPRPRAVEESEPALVRLRDAQQAWWTQEFTGGGVADPDIAREKLTAVQREWWENEGFAGDSEEESPALVKLEEMQGAWWKSEGFTLGKAPPDSRGSLTRLATINRQWWDTAQPKKPTPSSETEDDSGVSANGPEDVKVQLRDQKGTRAFLQAGGSEESEKAVQLGLAWIASQQRPDGRWSFVGPNQRVPATHPDTAATSMALLPFLARGFTHKAGSTPNPYAKHVEDGLRWLVKQQKSDGDLRSSGNLYTHALATMALCEAFNMTSDHTLRDPAQKAVNFTIAAQSPSLGGWRYLPRQGADLSVTSWNLMALKSGQMAGFRVPDATLTKANRYLQSVHKNGAYHYVPGQPGHSAPVPGPMTAAGMVCRHYLQGHDASDKTSKTDGVDIILARPPNAARPNYYYFYYSMYALFPIGGDAWKSWNPQVRDLVVRLQNNGNQNAKLKGSWDPRGGSQIDGAGRLAVTSMALLTLEVYYRHLPLNQPDLGQMTKEDLKATPKKKK